MTQVHKETLSVIENALPNRSGLEVEIFGMEGIPDEIVQSHNQRVIQQFAQAEADRRAATGNPGANDAGDGAAKKPKFEAPSDLKKRLAEHKAKKAAEEASGVSGGHNTPTSLTENAQGQGALVCIPSLAHLSKYLTHLQSHPVPQPYQQPQNGPVNAMPNSPFSPYPQSFSQPQPGPAFPPQQQQQQHPPPFQVQQPQGPHFPPPQQPQPGYGPPISMPQYPPNPAFASQQPYHPPGGPGYQAPPFQNGPPPFHPGPPQYHNGPPFQNGPIPFNGVPPQHFGAGSPPPYSQSPFQPPSNNPPPQYNGMPQRPPSLPMAPGLPQRPAFAAPPVNAQEMQQMHHGYFKNQASPQEQTLSPPPHANPNGASATQVVPGAAVPTANPLLEPPTVLSANASSLEELVSGAANDADKAASVAKSKEAGSKTADATEEKKTKKEKDKSMKLVYADNEVSPEEKMSKMPRYAFVRAG